MTEPSDKTKKLIEKWSKLFNSKNTDCTAMLIEPMEAPVSRKVKEIEVEE